MEYVFNGRNEQGAYGFVFLPTKDAAVTAAFAAGTKQLTLTADFEEGLSAILLTVGDGTYAFSSGTGSSVYVPQGAEIAITLDSEHADCEPAFGGAAVTPTHDTERVYAFTMPDGDVTVTFQAPSMTPGG